MKGFLRSLASARTNLTRDRRPALAVRPCWCYSTLRDAVCGDLPVQVELPAAGRAQGKQKPQGRASLATGVIRGRDGGCNPLQSLFRALNSAVECHLHTVEVAGSNPAAPTMAGAESESGRGPSLRSGFRHAARTPRKRLKFESCSAHHGRGGVRVGPRSFAALRISARGSDAAKTPQVRILQRPPLESTTYIRSRVRSGTPKC